MIKNKKLFYGILIIFVLVVIGIGLVFCSNTLKSVLHPVTPKTDHIIAKYSSRGFSPCPQFIITFEESNNQFNKTTECKETNLFRKVSIAEEEFNKAIYASFYLQGKNFTKITLGSLEYIKPHIESDTCMQSEDKVYTICYNKSGIIVDIYENWDIKGITDANSRMQLISIFTD